MVRLNRGLAIIGAIVVICAIGIPPTLAQRGLHVAYEWKQMDFAYRTDSDRQAAIESGAFVPANVIPVGLERHSDRLFVTLPRWKSGVPASLAYIDLNDTNTNTKSPLLHPYPSWGAHSLVLPSATPNATTNNDTSTTTTTETPPSPLVASEIVSPFRVRADRCDRLWVLDTGKADLLGQHPVHVTSTTQLLVYDLHNDNLLRRYSLPEGQHKHDSFFANIAVEIVGDDCADAFAYAADLGAPGLVVYSWRTQESWRVQHHYFHPDPLNGAFNVAGTRFEWDDGVFGLALIDGGGGGGGGSKHERDAQRRLYFHALSSVQEFSVGTAVLRNRTWATDATEVFAAFRLHGSRGTDGQSGASFGSADGVIYYTMPNRNALACWRPTETGEIDEQSFGVVAHDDVELVFANDVKVDAAGVLWVLSDNLQRFTYGEMDAAVINYRVLSGMEHESIAGTVCERGVETSTMPPTTTEHDHRGQVQLQGSVRGDDRDNEVYRTRATRRPTSGAVGVGGREVVGYAIVSAMLARAVAACL